MSSIYDWRTIAGDNDDSDSSINWMEGQAPGSVNNSACQMMARIAELLSDIGGGTVAGGAANVLTLIMASQINGYANGYSLAFRASADNTGAATLNVNALGAKPIRVITDSGEAALSAGMLRTGGVYTLFYSSAADSGSGAFILTAPTLESVTSVSDLIHGATEKTTPVNADEIGLVDSAASWALKKVTWANIKATLKTYFDTLYTSVANLASVADLRTGTADKIVEADTVHDAMAWVAITAGASPAVDHAAGVNRTIAHSANATMGNPTNAKPGMPLNIDITPGAYTTSWGSNYKFGSAGAPTITARTFVHFICRDTSTFVFLGTSDPS